MKYPIGIQDFEQIIQEGFAYVDKTDLVYKLAKEGKTYFLSRPRRFGKSLQETKLEDIHKGILKGLYSVFKLADSHLQFVFLTGVTKFSQVSVFSGFNQPQDISMDPRFETICGITTDEMLSIFDKPIQELASINKTGSEEMLAMLKYYNASQFVNYKADIERPLPIDIPERLPYNKRLQLPTQYIQARLPERGGAQWVH